MLADVVDNPAHIERALQRVLQLDLDNFTAQIHLDRLQRQVIFPEKEAVAVPLEMGTGVSIYRDEPRAEPLSCFTEPEANPKPSPFLPIDGEEPLESEAIMAPQSRVEDQPLEKMWAAKSPPKRSSTSSAAAPQHLQRLRKNITTAGWTFDRVDCGVLTWHPHHALVAAGFIPIVVLIVFRGARRDIPRVVLTIRFSAKDCRFSSE